MKNYLKILGITAGIQIASYIIDVIAINVVHQAGGVSIMGVPLLFIGFVISLVIGIVLAIKWGKSVGQKLIYVFLMPTNYTFLLLFFTALWYFAQWLEMLTNIYP